MSESDSRSKSKRSVLILLVLLLVLLASSLAVGPRVYRAVRNAMRPPDIELVSRESAALGAIDMNRLRQSGMWRYVMEVRNMNPDNSKQIDNMVKRSGFDPLQQVDTVFISYPLTRPPEGAEFGLIVHGGPFDEARFTAWSREELAKEKKNLGSKNYKGRTVWFNEVDKRPFFTFLDDSTMYFASTKWIEEMIDLADQPVKGPPSDVAPLLARVNKQACAWGAGLISESMRQAIKADPRFAIAGSMRSVYGSIDCATGLDVKAAVVFGTEQDAYQVAGMASRTVEFVKNIDQVQTAGLRPVVEAIKIASAGPEVTIDIKLTQAQVDDLILRLKTFFAGQSQPIDPFELLKQPGAPGVPAPTAPPAESAPPAQP